MEHKGSEVTLKSRDNTGLYCALVEQATLWAMTVSTEMSVAASKVKSARLTVRWKPYPATNFSHGIFAARCNVNVAHPLHPSVVELDKTREAGSTPPITEFCR